MPSFTTLYRAIVMIAAGVIVVKGWQLYGPTTEQVKSFGVRAIEMAQIAWDKLQPTDSKPADAAADPRLATEPPATVVPASAVEPAPLFSASGGTVEGVVAASDSEIEATESPAAATESMNSLPAGVENRLPALYARLEELGVSEPQLGPWGSSGHMYRFCCRAAVGETPGFSRHFESVAEEPLAAVEQVVAKVETWRATQREPVLGELR